MDYCGIYKFRNKENGKVYIGQSKRIYQRYGLHYNQAFTKKPEELLTEFDRALRQNPRAFEFEILEECPEEMLNIRELYWIEYYQQMGEMYNTQALPYVYQFTLEGVLLGSYIGYAEAARAVGKPEGRANIYKCCRGETQTAYGFKWSCSKIIDSNKEEAKPKPKPTGQKRGVIQLTQEGEIVATFSSVREAARAMGVTEGGIRHVCTGRSKSCKGYAWKYNEEEWSV